MRRHSAFVVSLLMLSVSPAFAEDSAADLKAEAAGLVKEYAASLQGTLKEAMQASGPVGGISVCHESAPQIAAAISSRSGWTVGRTSLKVRNPASAPDAYETKVMEEFQARLDKGEAVDGLVKAEVVDENGAKVFRFTKAIPTAQVCTTCHGTEIKPEIQARLNELYPGDKATGFKVGDMRGIFTLSKRL